MKKYKINLWTPRRMARIAIFGALTGAFSLIPIPIMPGMTLDPVMPAFAAVVYGAFEGYWSYVIGQLIRALIQNPGILVRCPLGIFMGSPCAMILVAWIVRKVRYPLNLLAGVLSGFLFHAFTIFPYCVIYYGWELTPIVYPLQLIGGLIVVTVCFFIAFGGSLYIWKLQKQKSFPWRFIPPEEHFSVASKKRIIIATIVAIITTLIAYGICFTPYVSAEIAGPPASPFRAYLDAWVRHPITFGLGWLFWELYKRNAEWFKQTE